MRVESNQLKKSPPLKSSEIRDNLLVGGSESIRSKNINGSVMVRREIRRPAWCLPHETALPFFK